MRLFPFLPEFAHFPRDFGRHIGFLRQILILSLTSFGGPQAHLALIIETLVKRRKYLSEEELLELFGLCQMLPGPTSTQTITAIGHKRGGPWLAFFTLIIWLGPACTIMGALAFLMAYSGSINLNIAFLSVLAPVSVGFLLSAGIKLTRTVINSTLKWVIMLLTAVISVILRNPFVFPALLILGGFISFQALPKEEIKSKAAIIPAWRNLYIFIGILIFSAVLGQVTKERAVLLFENTYRYGSLVFGGGQVLIPMMFDQYVRYKGYLTSQEFLTGYGFVQAMPGPVFSFSTYANALALKNEGYMGMLIGGFIGTVGIFAPGALLIFFVYPAWNKLRKLSWLKNALQGVNAAGIGLVAGTFYIFIIEIGLNLTNILIVVAVALLMFIKKLPTHWVIIGFVLANFVLKFHSN